MRNVLITGANKGIGFEVAKQMAQLGYRVYLGARDAQKGQEAATQLNVEFLQIDVSDGESVKQAAAKLDSLDILINNAGIPGGQPQNLSVCDPDNAQEIFNTNYFGAIRTTQAFLPLLKKSDNPVIVNVSSELGSLALQTSVNRNPNWNNYHVYGATKTALNAFTINLAQELPGFKINSVTPGYTATDLNNFAGFKTAAQGAEPIVKAAAIGTDGPTGQFFQQGGEVPW
jgi:NAD(P)-dependent dehydrogenase (short-subunit alcohol dehydrogenase family)